MYGAHSVSTEQQQMLLFLEVDSALRIINTSPKTIYFQLEISYEGKTGHSNRTMRGLTLPIQQQNQMIQMKIFREYLHKKYVTEVVCF